MKKFNKKEWDKQYLLLTDLIEWLQIKERWDDVLVVTRCQSSMFLSLPRQKSTWRFTNPLTGKSETVVEEITPDSMGPVHPRQLDRLKEIMEEFRTSSEDKGVLKQ